MKCNITITVIPHPNPDEVIDMLAQTIVRKLIDERNGKELKSEINTTT